MKNQKRIKQVFICLLALMFLIPLARQADALNYDGSGTSGGGVGSTNASSYTVAHTNTYSVIGYRFTGVLASDGSRPKNTPSIDICHKSAVNEGGYDKFSRCRPQFSKVEYAQGRRNGTPKVWTQTTNNWTVGALREGIDINFNTPLPVSSDAGQYATLMETWQNNPDNIDKIAKLVGYENGVNSMGKNDMIIVEPLFCVQIAGDFMAMTVSEMAQVGGESYNYDSNGWSYTGAGNYGSLGEDTWGFISNFTNRKWPNVLYATGEYGDHIWEPAPGAIADGSKATFNTLLRYGYGVAVCYQSKEDHRSHNLIIHYHSNYATEKGPGISAAVGSNLNEVVLTWNTGDEWDYDGDGYDNLHNYKVKYYGSYANQTYLGRDYYTGTGYWATADGYSVQEDKNFATPADLAEAFGVSIQDGDAEVHVYAQWRPNKLVINYYSNYADEAFAGTLNPVGSDRNVLVRTWDTSTEWNSSGDNLHNYTGYNAGTRLEREYYTATGYWATADGKYKVQQDTNYATPAKLAEAFGESLENGDVTINVYAQWRPNKLTINYYSNYADKSFSNPINAVGSSKNVLVRIWDTSASWASGGDNLHDYSYTSAGTYLGRSRYIATGYWSTADGKYTLSQSQNFTTPKDMAVALGTSLKDGDKSVNLYAQWEPRYDIVLSDIYFKAYDSNGNLYRMSDTQQMNIPIGTKVYVYYVYKNRSPVTVNITGYNTNGNAISYNGSTKYNISGWDTTLTVQAGSFTATPLGLSSITGSVYINGVPLADESSDIDGNAKTNNTRTENYRVKFDVAVQDIYLTDYEGNLIDADTYIPTNCEVAVHYVYKNNSGVAYTVNGYDGDDNKVTYNGSQSFTIPAYGTVDVTVKKMRTPSESGDFSLTAKVYRVGKNASTEKDEWDLDNNIYTKHYTVKEGPYLVPIEPNAGYREGTEVITSYWLINPTATNYTSSNKILVRIKVYDTFSGEKITEMDTTTVVPANEKQLVYFKWSVPYLAEYEDIKIVADLKLPENNNWWGRVNKNYAYALWNVYYTPDTSYEEKQPDEWTKPQSGADEKGKMSWPIWEYTNGAFKKQQYGIQATGGELVLTPQSKTAYQKNGTWYMKSGYGFTAEAKAPKISKYSGSSYKKPGADAYTTAQYAYTLYPEFGYQSLPTTMATMELEDGKWQLFEFLTYGRVHFTPIWFPDGTYDVRMIQSDIWTPLGAIQTQRVATIVIKGDMYDDWYIQGMG